MAQKELKRFIDHDGVEWIAGDSLWGEGIYFAENWFKHDVSGAGFTLEQLQDREYYEKYISIKEEKETIIIVHEDGTEEVFHEDSAEKVACFEKASQDDSLCAHARKEYKKIAQIFREIENPEPFVDFYDPCDGCLDRSNCSAFK